MRNIFQVKLQWMKEQLFKFTHMLDLQNILMNKNIFCVFEIKCRMPVHITARHMFKEKVTNVSQMAKKIIYLVFYLLVPKEDYRWYLPTRTLQMWLSRTKYVYKSIIKCQVLDKCSVFCFVEYFYFTFIVYDKKLFMDVNTFYLKNNFQSHLHDI